MSEETKTKEWGVVQSLKVEADTCTALVAAITIALTYNRKASHWEERDGELVFLWGKEGESDAAPFIRPQSDPERLAELALDWLKDSTYAEQPDTDGSIKSGYRVTIGYGCTVCKIAPAWIVYGK